MCVCVTFGDIILAQLNLSVESVCSVYIIKQLVVGYYIILT